MHVDTDATGPQPSGYRVGERDVTRPDTRGEAVLRVVRHRDGGLDVGERHRADDRTEDLLAHHPHRRINVGDDGRLEEVALGADAGATAHDPRAVGPATLHVPGDPLEV